MVEIAVSLALIGVFIIPMMMAFDNSILVAKRTDEYIKVKQLIRIAKENVTQSVKIGSPLVGGDGITSLNDGAGNVVEMLGVKIVTSDGDEIDSNYKYDALVVDPVNPSNTIASAPIGMGSDYANTCEYKIVLKKSIGGSYQPVKTVRINVNVLPDSY